VLDSGTQERQAEARGVLHAVRALLHRRRGGAAVAGRGGGGQGGGDDDADDAGGDACQAAWHGGGVGDPPLVLVMGDLNTTPATAELAELLQGDAVVGKLRDSWVDARPLRAHEAPHHSAQADSGGETWDPHNPHVRRQREATATTAGGCADQDQGGGAAGAGAPEHRVGAAGAPPTEVAKALAAAMDGRRMRLDYILVGGRISVHNCSVVMRGGDIDGLATPSDHFGVAAELELPLPASHCRL
jgi:endonuclease/exonuclease/phosphatase family metal-dependent hydrolase